MAARKRERVVAIAPSTSRQKKYVAEVRDVATKRTRRIHFGARAYEQYRDSTGLGVYKHKDHADALRRRRYFTRHSGVATKSAALAKEFAASGGRYNAKILSHKYLW